MKRLFLLLLVLTSCAPKESGIHGQKECEARVIEDYGKGKVQFERKDQLDDEVYWDTIIVIDKDGKVNPGSFNCFVENGKVTTMNYFDL